MNESPLPGRSGTERLVLGYILLRPKYLDSCRANLSEDDFTWEGHHNIWAAICARYDTGEDVDSIVVINDLVAAGKLEASGGIGYITSLTDGLPEVPSIDTYVQILKDCTLRRRIIYAAHHIGNLSRDMEIPATEVLDKFSEKLVDIASGGNTVNKPVNTREMMDSGLAELLRPRQQSGLKLPWTGLQEALCGLEGGQMVVILGETSRGKTSMALQIATGAAFQGLTPAIWTIEMSPKANFQRMASQLAGFPITKQFVTAEEKDRRAEALNALHDNPVHFDHTSRSVNAFMASLRQIRARNRLGLVVVDHLQLIRSENARNRAQEVSENSRNLKLAAADLGVPFVVLSQVDRSSVKGDGEIGLHSAKESGDIENDADVVMWIKAPEFARDQESPAQLFIGKQREGPTGFAIHMAFRPWSQTFVEVLE